MELNQECVRALLVCLAETQKQNRTGLGDPFILKHRFLDPALAPFSPAEVMNAARYLYEKGLIRLTNTNPNPVPREYSILCITAHGYDFLSSIRDASRWAKLKAVTGDIVKSSIPEIIAASTKILLG